MVARVCPAVDRVDHSIGIDLEARFRYHNIVDGLPVELPAEILIGAAADRILRLIFDIEEILGCASIGLGILNAVEVAHYHCGQRAELLYLVEHHSDTFYSRLVADMVKVGVEYDEFHAARLIGQYHIAANSVAGGAPILAHRLGSLGEPEGAFVGKLVFIAAIEYRAALRHQGFIPVCNDRVILRQAAAKIGVVILRSLLEADYVGRAHLDILDYEIGSVKPALSAEIGRRNAAQIAAHHPHLTVGGDVIHLDRSHMLAVMRIIPKLDRAQDEHDNEQGAEDTEKHFL